MFSLFNTIVIEIASAIIANHNQLSTCNYI